MRNCASGPFDWDFFVDNIRATNLSENGAIKVSRREAEMYVILNTSVNC
jgi:hypothetical protein